MGTVIYQGAISGASSSADAVIGGRSAGSVVFKAFKRNTPTVVTYNPVSGLTGSYRDNTANTNVAGGIDLANNSGMRFNSGGSAAGNICYAHWTADSEL